MKELYKALNDADVDITEYPSAELTDVEKKRMKKRLNKKLGNRKRGRNLKMGGIAAAVVMTVIIGANPTTLAKVPIIGSLLEDYLRVDADKTLVDYKTVIGKTVKHKEIEMTLNEVLIDEGRLVINSTLHADKSISEKLLSPFPSIYIDGEEVVGGGSGNVEKIDDATYTLFSAKNTRDMDLNKKLEVKIVYKDVGEISGEWAFEFQTSGASLFAEAKTISIGKEFSLENGQRIIVDEIVLTPASTTLHYQMLGERERDFDYDVHFRVKDETGKQYSPTSGVTSSGNSHIRFGVLDEKVTELTITPFLISGKEGKEKTDYYEVLTDEVFEVELK